MCSVNGEPVVLEVEYCSSESEAHPVSHLLDSDGTHWRAGSAVATIHLSLNPPSAISAVVISNAGCAELGFVAMGRGSAAGSYLGGAAPRQDFRALGDAVQLLPPFTLSSPTGMTVFRVGRGEGRLSTVATTQPWTHLVLELRGLPPHCPGIGHVQVRCFPMSIPRWNTRWQWPSANWPLRRVPPAPEHAPGHPELGFDMKSSSACQPDPKPDPGPNPNPNQVLCPAAEPLLSQPVALSQLSQARLLHQGCSL